MLYLCQLSPPFLRKSVWKPVHRTGENIVSMKLTWSNNVTIFATLASTFAAVAFVYLFLKNSYKNFTVSLTYFHHFHLPISANFSPPPTPLGKNEEHNRHVENILRYMRGQWQVFSMGYGVGWEKFSCVGVEMMKNRKFMRITERLTLESLHKVLFLLQCVLGCVFGTENKKNTWEWKKEISKLESLPNICPLFELFSGEDG